ncbi:MAG: MFS transporter [Dehalococcoidia bacterium]|nr:MFS transporter [Dehalococcoidia bacterium]
MGRDEGQTSFAPTSWLTVGLVSLGVFFTALDQTVVVTVLPEIMLDMEIPVAELDQASWIITGYLLGYTVVIPLVARLSDAYGHAYLFRGSLVVFAMASALVALSPNLPWLVGARVLQALGGGAIIPIGMTLVTQALPGHRRAMAVGVVGAAAEMGVVLGPLYGGAITEVLGWRWLFWMDVPQAAVILLTIRAISNRPNPCTRVDYLGGLLLAAALTMAVIALSRRDLFAAASVTPYLLLQVAAFGILAFVWRQRRADQPLLTPVFFRSKAVLSAVGAKLLMGAALIIALVTVPLMANTVLEQSPLEGGLRLMRLTGTIPIGALLGGYLTHRVGAQVVAAAGLLVAALGLFLMSGWELDISDPQFTLHLGLVGLGFGLVIAPLFVTAMDASPDDYQATGASLVTVARMIGMALGLAALSAWGMDRFLLLTSGLPPALSPEYPPKLADASMTLFQDFFRLAMALCIAALVPVLGMMGRSKR